MPRKSSKIRLARGLELPGDAVTQTFGLMARRGAGKTYCAQKLAEGMLDAGAQIVALDPIGNWWSLRLGADGKSAGYDIPVFGGLRGDIPLQPTAGELVADVVADTGTSVVLDLSQFRKSERKRFVADFCERLFMLRKRDPSPTHIFLEEAQAFIPQRVGKDETRMAGAVEDIVRMGRNFGLGATMISQRPQSVNKEVLNQVECLVLLQINGAHERKAVEQWVTYQGIDVEEMVRQLPSLKIGEAFVWSPQWLDTFKRVKIGQKATFDASATPRLGRKKRERKLGPVDLEQIQDAMKSVVEESAANDPKQLKKEITRLQRELRKGAPKDGGVRKDADTATEVKELRATLREAGRKAKAAERVYQAVRGRALKQLAQLERACAAVREILEEPLPDLELPEVPAPSRSIPTIRTPSGERAATTAAPRLKARSGSNGVLGKGARGRVLEVLLQHPDGIPKAKVLYLAKISPRSSTLSVALSELRAEGLEARAGGDTLKATEKAFELYGDQVQDLPTGDELRQHYLGLVGETSASGRVLALLYQAWPEPLTDDELCDHAEISRSSSTLSVVKSELRKLQLIDKSRGGAKALDHLFED